MNPLIGIAAGVLPDIIKLIAGDKTGQLADQVGKAVADAVGTTDAGEAQTKLAANPAAQVALRQKLAELAVEAAKTQNAEADRQRHDTVSNTQRASGVGHDEYDDRPDGADDLLPRDRRFLHFLICPCLAVLVGA
jgi:nucleoid-associated protein YgaU